MLICPSVVPSELPAGRNVESCQVPSFACVTLGCAVQALHPFPCCQAAAGEYVNWLLLVGSPKVSSMVTFWYRMLLPPFSPRRYMNLNLPRGIVPGEREQAQDDGDSVVAAETNRLQESRPKTIHHDIEKKLRNASLHTHETIVNEYHNVQWLCEKGTIQFNRQNRSIL